MQTAIVVGLFWSVVLFFIMYGVSKSKSPVEYNPMINTDWDESSYS